MVAKVNRSTDLEWNIKPWSRHNFDTKMSTTDGPPPSPPPHIAMAQKMMTSSLRPNPTGFESFESPSKRSPKKAPYNAQTENFKPWSRHLEEQPMPSAKAIEGAPDSAKWSQRSSVMRESPQHGSHRPVPVSRLFKPSFVTSKVTSEWAELSPPTDRPGDINVGGSKLSRNKKDHTLLQRSTLGSFTTPIIVYRPEEEMSNEHRSMRQRLRRIADADMANKSLFSSFGGGPAGKEKKKSDA